MKQVLRRLMLGPERTNETVWVTGCTGFIGNHLAQSLARDMKRVIGFARLEPDQIPSYFEKVLGGGLSLQSLETAISSAGMPSAVYHFSGGGTVGASIEDPLTDFDSSVASTARLLDYLRRHCCNVPVVIASSAAVYGGGHAGPIKLNAHLAPFSPYGHHKRMTEHLAITYAETFNMKINLMRLFSIYGRGLSKQLLFDICKKIEAGDNPVVLGGTGKELRDWCHVSDVVEQCRSIQPASPGIAQVFNIGTGRATETHEIACAVSRNWEREIEFVFNGISRRGDPFSLVADRDSLPLGFKPKVSIDQGVADFVEWFRGGTNAAGSVGGVIPPESKGLHK